MSKIVTKIAENIFFSQPFSEINIQKYMIFIKMYLYQYQKFQNNMIPILAQVCKNLPRHPCSIHAQLLFVIFLEYFRG